MTLQRRLGYINFWGFLFLNCGDKDFSDEDVILIMHASHAHKGYISFRAFYNIGQDFSDVVLKPALQGLDTYIYIYIYIYIYTHTQPMHTNVKRLGYISFRVINNMRDFI